MVLLRTSFSFSGTQYACMNASSCIYTLFFHALGPLREEASRCFTGAVRMKSNGFPKDILHFFRIAVCLYERFLMHLHCALSCFMPPKGKASRCFTGTIRIKSDGFANDILHVFVIAVCLYERFILYLHCVLLCFRPS